MILYGIQFTTKLDQVTAAVTADAIIGYNTFDDGPQFYLDAINAALASDAVIMTEEWAEPPYGREDLRHTEQEVRQFLAHVAEDLIRRQPWPPKPGA
ncbi:hypothetical protein H7J87_26830 [Mycolicibacterium wolinskyi]|uniref:Uncharacterized protein n=1 Tax=Mycolicibacterium wolinskyi TaxID=59750 RepID=A0A1X2ESX6_9MYCO|nr:MULTISPECIES: hypothetical protein [Mycolicibacterium]MCV7288949.1 hypothetical protein [Mycolicibacterium wolinskyi]MCV7296986.1 hypothetical protein [Mycolicibacterium goodii]ORX09118.1 hypothetical protein AWC31_09165 [Mycolicibacterium wolinskyi]